MKMDQLSLSSSLSLDLSASEQSERDSSSYYPWGSPVTSPDSGKSLWNSSGDSRSSTSSPASSPNVFTKGETGPIGTSYSGRIGKAFVPEMSPEGFCSSSWTEGIPLEDQAERPSFLNLRNLLVAPSSIGSSGYCTGESSTVSEHPPYGWDSAEAASTGSSSPGPQMQVISPEGEPFRCGELCTFTVYFPALADNQVCQLHKKVEAYAIAPEPVKDHYPVLVSKGEFRNEIKCSFKPFTCGTFKVCVRSLMNSKSASEHPVVATCEVQKNYQKTDPIVTRDIELPNWDAETEAAPERKPWGIACNLSTEELIVPDRSRHEILVYQPDGSLSFSFGARGNGPGQFFRPIAATYDQKRNRIIVVDKDNHRVQFFDPRGNYLGTFGRFGNGNGGLKFPWGIDMSPDGEMIAVADTRNYRVQLFDYNGKYLRTIRGNSTELVSPRSVCFSKTSDEVFITDFKLHHVLKYDLTCDILTIIARNLQRPSGLSLDHVGNLLVCNNRGNSVLIYPKEKGRQTEVLRYVGSQRVEQPSDMVIMKGSYMAMLDHNGRITVF